MQQNQPVGLPWPAPEFPSGPVVVPLLPRHRRRPGRAAPLPDPVAVCLLAVPDSAPPFDDEEVPEPAASSGAQSAAASLAETGGAAPGGIEHDQAQAPAPARRDDGQATWPSQFAQALAETLAGSRPSQQLVPWTTEQTRRQIRQLGPTLVTDQRPRVRRIMTSAPSKDVLELTAVVGFGPKVRVLAVRMERSQAEPPRSDARWRCTVIESA